MVSDGYDNSLKKCRETGATNSITFIRVRLWHDFESRLARPTPEQNWAHCPSAITSP
jgi:hypothetical protein